MAHRVLLAAALLVEPAAALRTQGAPKHLVCKFGPGVVCTDAAADSAVSTRWTRAEGTYMDIWLDDRNEIEIKAFSGRMANHLRSFAWTCLMAESLGRDAVRMNNSIEILSVPERVVIDGNMKGKHRCGIFGVGCFNGNCYQQLRCDTAPKHELRRVLASYAWPHLTSEARAACAPDTFDGLTMHLRAGDLLSMVSVPKLAPCAYYSKIIRTSGFKEVRMVTEPDWSHPCIKALPERHPSVSFTSQSLSVTEDFCTLVRARNLAKGTERSSFESMSEVMNPNVRNVYRPESCKCTRPAAPGTTTETCYIIRGLDEQRTDVVEREAYMLSTPESDVQQLEAQCASDDMPLDKEYAR